jgi:hypothetical protein
MKYASLAALLLAAAVADSLAQESPIAPPLPTTTPPAASAPTSAPATQPLDLSTPQKALKALIVATRSGDLAAARQAVLFPTAQDRETFDLLVAPEVARIRLARTAIARLGAGAADLFPEMEGINASLDEQIQNVDTLKLQRDGHHATLSRVLPPVPDAAPASPATARRPATRSTTSAATSAPTPPASVAPATAASAPAPAADRDDDDEPTNLVRLEADNAWHWRVVAVRLADNPEPEELPSLRHSVPATIDLYDRLRQALESGQITTAAALKEQLDAGELAVMGQALPEPETTSSAPATRITSQPATAPDQKIDTP